MLYIKMVNRVVTIIILTMLMSWHLNMGNPQTEGGPKHNHVETYKQGTCNIS